MSTYPDWWSDMEWDQAIQHRIPFFAYPNGSFKIGDPGMRHDEISDHYGEPFHHEIDPRADDPYQGDFILAGGELGEHWPVDYKTLKDAQWLTPEQKEAIRQEAYRRARTSQHFGNG